MGIINSLIKIKYLTFTFPLIKLYISWLQILCRYFKYYAYNSEFELSRLDYLATVGLVLNLWTMKIYRMMIMSGKIIHLYINDRFNILNIHPCVDLFQYLNCLVSRIRIRHILPGGSGSYGNGSAQNVIYHLVYHYIPIWCIEQYLFIYLW